MLLFIAGTFLTLSMASEAAPRGGSFRAGFGGHGNGAAFRMATGGRRNFAANPNRRFFRRDRGAAFQQFAWPLDWYPYDYSYLDDGPDSDYQYWDSSVAPAQLGSQRQAADRGPTVIIINNKGNSWPMDSNSNPGYVSSGYSVAGAPGQQRTANQDPSDKAVSPTDPAPTIQPAQAAARAPQITPQVRPGIFGNLVLVSWLQDAGKNIIYVQNVETNDVQKITSQPNLDNFRIVELHPNSDPKLVEAVISNGSQQGPVRFRF
jgi:hypothetical protein